MEGSKLPAGFEKLPNDDNWKEQKANLPRKGANSVIVFVSKTPSELVLVEGSPKLEKVLDSKTYRLEWVKNTESDLFRYKEKSKKDMKALFGEEE